MITPEEDRLLLRYLDGKLTPDDETALQTLLRHNADARKRLRMHSVVAEGISDRPGLYPVHSRSVQGTVWKKYLPWVIAGIAVLLAIPRPEKTAEDPFLALIVDEAGAEFAAGKSPDGIRFTPGDYQLDKGALHVRFSNGADVIMKAPAAFKIDDAFHLRLHDGGLRAVVPPAAQGFTIATPGIDYEDLGTEFGLSVDKQSGNSQLHVFDGQVDAKEPGSKKLMSSIREGESVAFANGTLEPTGAPDAGQYLTPGSIGFLRWKQQRENFAKDPDLIGYYPFIKNKALVNQADQPITSDGLINGARWVTGRWPGKKALLFDRDTDFVELDIPGNYTELTFATWVKLDRLDFSHTAIFDSNLWDSGDIHWQLNRSGTMWIAPFEGAQKENTPRKTVPTGQWVHLAATISIPDRKSRVYLNGQLVGSMQISNDAVLAPGVGRIGNWLRDEKWPHAPIRAMRGRMDEFAIWKRALTEAEVKKLVTAGKPAEIWSTQLN